MSLIFNADYELVDDLDDYHTLDESALGNFDEWELRNFFRDADPAVIEVLVDNFGDTLNV